MDIKQMLPFLLKGRLGEKEQAILNMTKGGAPDPKALGDILSQMHTPPKVDTYSILKKIMPAQTLGQIIKYFDSRKSNQN